MEDTTKDYIINLRVSRKTYDKIKDRAKKNGETISNLIRSIINDSAEVISDLSSELTGKKTKDKFADIVSYSRAVLAQSRPCDNCGKEMAKGETVIAGETATRARYYFCPSCKELA